MSLQSGQAIVDRRSVRVAVVALALLILCFRLPTYFAYPQFWAEDALAWMQTHVYGARSLVMPMAGYHLVAMHLVAWVAALFPIAAAPAIYFYATVTVALAVVWLIMSPRFDIPFRPLGALAVVTSYQGIFALGGVANLQWLLPVGASAIIFMRPPRTRVIFVAELLFIAMMSVTGPFSIFLAPILAAALLMSPRLRTRRHLAFLLVNGLGAAIQATSMLIHIDDTLAAGARVRPSLSAAINMPFHQLFSPLGAHAFTGRAGATLSVGLAAIIASLAFRPPYRMEKLFVLAFSILLFAGAVAKSGVDLNPSYGLRYFYIPSVFAAWFAVFVSASLRPAYAIAALVAACELTTTAFAFNTGSIDRDFEWRVWSTAIQSGLPVTFPTSPVPWAVNLPAATSGPFHALNAWVGQPIGAVATISEQPCAGTILAATAFSPPDFSNVPGVLRYAGMVPRWRIAGETPDPRVRLLVFTDSQSRVLGFGFAGFAGRPGVTTWIGMVPSPPDAAVTVYGVATAQREVCVMTAIHMPAS